jgi:fimbrial chaperone protein
MRLSELLHRAHLANGGWLMLAALPATASTFTVAPIGLQLSPAHRTGVLTIRNNGDEPTLVQVRALAWSQTEGVDQYDPTPDVLITPPVFQIQPKGDQIVRVVLRRNADPARELTYRVFLQEVPPARQVGGAGLSMVLEISLPLFVPPSRAAQAEVVWRAQRLADGSLRISADNQGSAHLRITNFDLRFDDTATPIHISQPKYALPDSQVSWIITLPADAHLDSLLKIQGDSNQGEFSTQADVAAP